MLLGLPGEDAARFYYKLDFFKLNGDFFYWVDEWIIIVHEEVLATEVVKLGFRFYALD